MDVASYFRRISYFGGCDVPSIEILRNICTAHVQSVPFENFSVIAKESIELNEEFLFNKIVTKRRGGFCYELNSLFHWLLKSLGFDVILLSARVFNRAKQQVGPEFDHVTLSVSTPQRISERYLVDVGFPDALGTPLRLVDGASQKAGNYDVRLRVDASSTWYVETKEFNESSEWEKRYQFSLQPRELDDFAKTLFYHQTSPDGPFTQKRVASIITKDTGRVLFTDDGEKGPRIVETKQDDSRSSVIRKITLLQEGQVKDILRLHFGLVL
jgi:N-hydroxyarylamine O-acetyltransferase